MRRRAAQIWPRLLYSTWEFSPFSGRGSACPGCAARRVGGARAAAAAIPFARGFGQKVDEKAVLRDVLGGKGRGKGQYIFESKGPKFWAWVGWTTRRARLRTMAGTPCICVRWPCASRRMT